MAESFEKKHPVLAVVGPTATGKTALGVALAEQFGGEIISADSMQVYRHMDIGSAKVTKEEMDGVRHHLIDVLDPWDEFNVVVFQRLAKQAMEEIYADFGESVHDCLAFQRRKFEEPECRYAWKIREQYGQGFVARGLQLARQRQREYLEER